MSLLVNCHCGAVQIELPRPPEQAKECNCTFCARTGAVWGYYPPEDLSFIKQDGERTYSASGGMNRHHFCGSCGMQTWGDSPDWASMYNADGSPKSGEAGGVPDKRISAVNLRLIDDLDLSTIVIEKVDGRNNW